MPASSPFDGAPRADAQPASTPNPYDRRPRVLIGLDRFWQRVTEGMQVSDLWLQFKRDAQTGFQLYRRDYEAGVPIDQTRQGSFFHRAQEISWAILSKLTPARRVLLLIGIVLLLFPSGSFQFQKGATDVQISTLNFQFWGGAVLFLLLMLEIADRVVMKRDLEIARDIQSWLLPEKPPSVPGLTIAFATRPANTVAGDYYDVFARPNQQNGPQDFLFTVADVAGKSIPAALLMATFQASLKTLSSTPCSLKQLVEAMNRYACGNSQGGLRFTTAFLAEYDPASRALNYVNAGHNNPIVLRNSGTCERLTTGGLPLGIQTDAGYETGSTVLAAGDWLVVFTDGLVEAVDPSGEEYGETRLLSSLAAGSGLAPQALLAQVTLDVNRFVGATPQHDDITCMLIKVN